MTKERTYTNGEVTIIWKKELCAHSTRCWKGLGTVFQPGQRPWIKPEGAPTERIIEQVLKCPSGTLSHRMNDAPVTMGSTVSGAPRTIMEASLNGPLLVRGACEVKHSDGRTEVLEKGAAFCRCGASANKPYCDGSHRRTGFQG